VQDIEEFLSQPNAAESTKSMIHRIPNPYSMSLLRVHRAQSLCNALDGEEVREHLVEEKCGLAEDILSLLNDQTSVTRRRNIWIAYHTFKETIMYAVIVSVLVVAVLSSTQISPMKYKFNTVASMKTIGNEFPMNVDAHGIKFFGDISNIDDMWTFLDNVLVGNLFPDLDSGWLDEHNRLVGGILLHQERDENACQKRITGLWEDLGLSSSSTCYSFDHNSTNHGDVIIPAYSTPDEAAAIVVNLQNSTWVRILI
jgi:hypothetical protein